jgi:putative membrane protein
MRRSTPVWLAVAAAVLVQIVYPLMPEVWRTPITVLSVVVFATASLADVARRHGACGLAALVGIAGGGGLAVEALGVRTGFPFGDYAYTGTLGPELFGVPAVVPLAWIMMAWPALVVGRTLARRAGAVGLVGGVALAAWDVFLDPQMVDAGHWRWAHPYPALPLVPGVPLTNFAGWAVVAVLMVGLVHRTVGGRAGEAPSGPATALYLWAYSSSVIAHAAFFDRPGSALVGGLVMGAVALPFAVVALRGPVTILRTRVSGNVHGQWIRPRGARPGTGRGQQPGEPGTMIGTGGT